MSEGRSGSIYNAHSYHTKVPYKAIMKYIQHYTDEEDIIFDGFCGTGMVGIASKFLNRRVILIDLSPNATFIAYNYNNPVNIDNFEKESKQILNEVKEECYWMYETNHIETDDDVPENLKKIKKKYNDKKGIINYILWSDVYICPYCNEEYSWWDATVEHGFFFKEYRCPNCSVHIKKTDCNRVTVTFYDKFIQQQMTQAKQVPVLINYTWNKKRYQKMPDLEDFALIRKIEELDCPYWFPINKLPSGYNTEQPIRSHGVTHIHHFYTKRNLWVLSSLWNKAKNNYLKFLISSYNLTHSTKMSRIILKSGNIKPVLTGCQSGTLYISSLPVEKNIIHNIRKMKLNLLKKMFSKIPQKKML